MATICLSPILGLRCLGLSHIQEAISVVPICLEVVFSLGLIFAGRDAGRIRYLLAAEGPLFLFLAILSLLSHVIPSFQNNLTAFKALDIVIGVTAFAPILLYTTFFYLFNQREFFPRFPMRFMGVAKIFLLAVIPMIVVTNEIGSFMGVQYRLDPDASPSMTYQLGGPGMGAQEFARELLSSTSLALLAAAQALTFLLSFVALMLGLVKQRHIEDRAATELEGVLFRGLGWLTVGANLSVIETAFGWVAPSFGLVLLRRGLRMIARACLIIGVVKGPERKEEFIMLDDENGHEFRSGTRKLTVTGLRLQISSPRLVETSMSYRLSHMTILRPFARSDPASEQTLSTSRRTSTVPLSPSTRTPTSGTKARPPPLILGPSSEGNRVTVTHALGRAPTLVLDLSSMGLPSADTLAAMSEGLSSAPVSVMVPMPLSHAAPLTAPLPPTTSETDRRRRSSYFSVRPIANTEVSGALESRGISRSRPSSPNVPHTVIRPLPAIPRVSQRAPASEHRAPATPSSMRTQPDRRMRQNSTTSGPSTEWTTSDDDSIKSVGAVQPHITPRPTRDMAVRASIVLERLSSTAEVLPPTPEQGANLIRKDSGVLGPDDLVHMRARRAKNMF